MRRLGVNSLFISYILGLPCNPLLGQDQLPTNLKVITYNVQFLPKMVRKLNKRPDVEFRAEALGTRLRDFDLIAFNELFDQEPRDLLLTTLKNNYGEPFHKLLPPVNTESTLGIGSGLAIVCRLEIVDSHYLRFGSAGGPLKNLVLADGAAAKGALHAQLRAKPDCELDVFVTHLESRNSSVRRKQYQALGRFVGKYQHATRPVLILGDFNIHGVDSDQNNETSPYNKMISSLQENLPNHDLQDTWLHLGEGSGVTADFDVDGGQRLDYVFLANPRSHYPRLSPTVSRVNRFPDERGEMLSDHAAVEAEFKWELR